MCRNNSRRMNPSSQNPYYLHSLYSSSQSNAQTLEEQYKKNPNQNLILQQQLQQLQQLQQQQQQLQSANSSSNSQSTSGSSSSSGSSSPSNPLSSSPHPMMSSQYPMGYPPQYPSMVPPQHPMFSTYPAYYQGQPSHPFQAQPIPGQSSSSYMNGMYPPYPYPGMHSSSVTAQSQSSQSTSSVSPSTAVSPTTSSSNQPSTSESASSTPAITLQVTPSAQTLQSKQVSLPSASVSSSSNTSSSSETAQILTQNQHIRHPNPVEVQPTTASQGALYPIKRRIQKRVICFDSRFRDNYMETSSSDFIYTLPYPIKNVISVRLNSLELPNSWYSYCEAKKTNIFQIIDASNVSRYITYPDGNYQAMDFDAASKTLLTEAFGANHFELLVSLTSGKTMIRDLCGNPFQLKFNTGNVNSDIRKNLGWYMGFRKASYSGESIYESEGVYNAGGNDYIYFVLNDFNHSEAPSVVAMMDNTVLDDNILAKIPISNDKFQILFDSPGNGVTKQREYMGSVTLSRLHIKILNEFGDRIDFNKMDYSFSLELEIAFE
jgi:hypothetical protein